MSETVWIHGTGLNGLRWGPQAETGLWPDLPGHGAAPRAGDTVAAYAKALVPGLPPRFAIVGHSLGGMVAMALAARAPDRCRALILIDVPLSLPDWMPKRLGVWTAPVFSRFPGPRGFARMMARRTENVTARPAIRDRIEAMDRGGFQDAMVATARFDGRPLLPKLTMPVLSLLGRDSMLTGQMERHAYAALPKAELVEIEAGHMLPFDAAETIDPMMTRFLEMHR
ncbi:alpha/beta hydrolase family protein [Roseibacterium elongatum DSM 19469]|uniref:Alpha/beta hydrolase family protein n=1 Tax=Roseicyclus elongatus DSM 19469 TaxID=1294273 RepID=W8S6P6_9RHOB|nr:alpha/beta hydrolase [Roseibacterium elongatum]AHM04561.1 alpha/beta hydrolase family protein [Roseibacterium elongatum DSM 19469]